MKIKILHTIIALNNGGSERSLQKLIYNIDNNIFENRILCIFNEGYVGKEIEKKGFKVYVLFRKNNIINFLKSIKKIRKYKPDIIQTWLPHADFLGGFIAFLTGSKNVIWNLRLSNIELKKNKLHSLFFIRFNALLSWFVPKKIICNSSKASKVHINIGYKKDKICYVPNGFDTDRFNSDKQIRRKLRKNYNIPIESKVFGLIGRYTPLKNHIGFLNAAQLILRKNTNVLFLLAGENIDQNNIELMKIIKKNKLEKHIILLGIRDDIENVINCLDFSICCSYGESFPNIIGESMSCAVPCIVSKVGDCSKIIEDSGWIFKSTSSTDIADKLNEVLKIADYEIEKKGSIARSIIKEKYSMDISVSKYEKIYLAIMEEN